MPFCHPLTSPLAQFAFAPNPVSGLDTLPTAATITAGFAAGISPVTFTAPANTDLDRLASLLDSALMGGGYLTSMPDPTDVVVFADGVSLPVEVDFTLEPIGTVPSDGGIETTLIAFNVPEPATWALLALGFTGLGYAGFRRARKNRLTTAIV